MSNRLRVEEQGLGSHGTLKMPKKKFDHVRQLKYVFKSGLLLQPTLPRDGVCFDKPEFSDGVSAPRVPPGPRNSPTSTQQGPCAAPELTLLWFTGNQAEGQQWVIRVGVALSHSPPSPQGAEQSLGNTPGFPKLLSKANDGPQNPLDFSHAFLRAQATSPNSSFQLFIAEEKLPIYVEVKNECWSGRKGGKVERRKKRKEERKEGKD